MQPLDYSLLNKKGIVVIKPFVNNYKSTFMDENRHSKLFADDKVNDYINEQIKKAMCKLDEKYERL